MSLPEGWFPRDYVSHEAVYGDPPRSPNAGRILMFGLMEGDEGHRIYDIPVHASFGGIARAFRVGSHGAQSYGYDEDDTVEMIARKLDVIEGIAPGRVTFADAAGFKVRFTTPISGEDYP